MIRSFPARPGRARLARSAVLALAIELLMGGGLAAWLATPAPVARRAPAPMEIALAAPDVPKPPAAPAPKPAVPPPTPTPTPTAPAHRMPPRAVPRQAASTPPSPPPSAAPTQAAPPAPPVSPASAPEPATPPRLPAAPAAPHADPSFEGALRGAIQAALHYPESARLAQMSGRARVAFHYRDGAVADVRLVASSGVGLLDRAALAAVRDASYPKPPAALAGQTLAEQLWVTFNLDDTP